MKVKWQDIAVTSAGFIFTIIMIPQLVACLNGASVNVISGGLTASLCYFLAYVFYSLGLKLSVLGEGCVATMWAVITYLSWLNQ